MLPSGHSDEPYTNELLGVKGGNGIERVLERIVDKQQSEAKNSSLKGKLRVWGK